MTPDISEFTYGFALTNELVGWMALSAVPIFPSLIEEGKATGGYDVKLDAPGVPLYLQFKRSHVMTRRSANEIKNLGLSLNVPFHRFAITERKRSLQHTALVTLDNGTNQVFYVAPRFHTLAGINAAWSSQKVAQRSIFISPASIGVIADDFRHTVSFDDTSAYFCSEPQKIEPVGIESLRARLTEKLQSDARPVRDKLTEWLAQNRAAATRAREIQSDLEAKLYADTAIEGLSDLQQSIALRPPSPAGIRRIEDRVPTMPVRAPKELTPEHEILRVLSDEAQSQFNAQLIVVQSA
ncbi:hypothetical protein [Sphingomonas sp. UNC305MFCol5.2]|uniref:hypothetical protein n=1 Tax=Sphingomonas sp. UNC305MFCol5.2 TaxID=1449076 RepID=UPI0006764DC4|nr:hypothetical protein [Sphingomonas sp. UNC305MFCol5.2]